MEYILYSDGGGNGQTDIASSFIVDDLSKQHRYYLTAYLGKGTNNEAEIIAGLLGLSAVRALISKNTNQKFSSAGIIVKWVADSEYVLKGASEYITKWVKNDWRKSDDKLIKNLGLWKTYLCLKGGLQGGIGVITEHVKGHSGHRMNELCDNAATWTRLQAPHYLNPKEPHMSVNVQIPFKVSKKEKISTEWVLLDAQGWLDSLRTSEPKIKDSEFYITAFIGGA